MPVEDKSEAQSAVSAVASEGTVPRTQNRTEPAPAAALPLEGPLDDSATKVIVEVRHVSEEIIRVELQAPPAAADAAAPGAAARPAEESGIIKAAREEPTVLQDDRAQKESRWKSLETSRPTVPGYELVKKLGQGTYGVVWHAREEGTGIEVAIKFFAHGTGDQWQTLQAEVKQLAMLHADPGIVQLIDVEPDAVPPYFVMDYAEQGSLAKRLESGPLPLEESLKIFQRVVEALAYVHAKGVRHCDLKPGNILLDARGRPKVADFGQAHLSSDASPALGTFFYMAPEQADLERQIPDTRWDVYGLGALLYAMVTGGPPREDSTVRTQLAATEHLAHRLANYRSAVVNAPPATKHRQVPGMDRPLADIISRCLEVNPGERFHDANAILDALHRREWNRQQRPLLTYGLVVPLLLLVALGYLGYSQANDATEKFRQKHAGLVQSDCETAAGLIQSVVKNKLLEQAERVLRVAKNKELLKALQDKEQLLREALLTREMPEAGDDPRAQNLKLLRDKLVNLSRTFESWALTDSEGTSIAGDVFVAPQKDESPAAYERRWSEARRGQESRFGKDFSWRQWFNGERDYPENDFTEQDKLPIRTDCGWIKPDALAVRMTDSSYKTKRRNYAIGFSAPVYLEEKNGAATTKKLAGVFLANLSMEKFWEWLAEAKMPHGHALILDRDRRCVFPSQRFATDRLETDNNLVFPDAFDKVIWQQRQPGVWNHDKDELKIDGKTQLWGYAPIIDSEQRHGGQLFHWLAIVGQNHQTVMDPVDTINEQWMIWGLIKLLAGCLLLLAMWAWLRRKLLRPERLAHA